jgi:hypothetical protein
LHGEGIEIVVVDPAKATGKEWDLARRFEEIEECQTFIGLLTAAGPTPLPGPGFALASQTASPRYPAYRRYIYPKEERPLRDLLRRRALLGAPTSGQFAECQ